MFLAGNNGRAHKRKKNSREPCLFFSQERRRGQSSPRGKKKMPRHAGQEKTCNGPPRKKERSARERGGFPSYPHPPGAERGSWSSRQKKKGPPSRTNFKLPIAERGGNPMQGSRPGSVRKEDTEHCWRKVRRSGKKAST